MTMTVSIALCTYNGASFLLRQLESLAAQTILPDEVVISDDASTDATLEIIDTWRQSVPFNVRLLINKENIGYQKNFRRAMSECRSDIVILCDQDDLWHDNRIAVTLSHFEANDSVGALFCNADLIDSFGASLEGDLVSYTRPWQCFREPGWLGIPNPPEMAIYGCCIAVRRSVLAVLPPIPDDWGHDVWLFALLPHLTEYEIEPQQLFSYRLHQTNVSSRLQPWYYSHWRASYFREAVFLNKIYSKKRDQLLATLDQLPPTLLIQSHRRKLELQRAHWTARTRIQHSAVTALPRALLELFTGRYFLFPQPVKSLLFDLKESLDPWPDK